MWGGKNWELNYGIRSALRHWRQIRPRIYECTLSDFILEKKTFAHNIESSYALSKKTESPIFGCTHYVAEN